MLRELSIKNFAIIDDLHIRFSKGLTILSGETGAGKSIIINAVNLLLGSRADAGFIRTGADTAELEVLFEVSPDSSVAGLLATNGYDPSFSENGNFVIRRIISRNDKHRAYINGRNISVKLLSTVTENLAGISGQHAHQGLLNPEQHLLILDQFGGLMTLREKVYQSYQEIVPMLRRLAELNEIKSRQLEQRELLEFQQTEIAEADVRAGEDAALERERVILKNGKMLYQAVYSGIEELYSAQNAIVERLVEVKKRLEKACEIDPELSSQAKGLDNTTFQIEDIVANLRDYLHRIQIDEKRPDEVDARLDMLQKLKRKHGGSLEAVLSHLESVEERLSKIENISDSITETEELLSEQKAKFVLLVAELSEKRKAAAEILARKVEAELDTLQMSHTRFQILIQPVPPTENLSPYLVADGNALNETGMDRAAFLISPNVGESLKPLASIASGGELSRVVLALKAILAQSEFVETVIFDEVDAGIGGSVAEVVGRKLSSLAAHHQVICITHLPQIAKFGDHHFRISKQVSSGRTRTAIDLLDKNDRVREIARMLGGVKLTQTTLDHALEMLGNR